MISWHCQSQSVVWRKKNHTKMLAQVLFQDSSERFRSAQAIVNANTPIVRVKDRVTGIKCDLNAASRMGVVNSAFIRFCADSDSRVKDLMMVVKVFASRHGLTGSGRGSHFSSYGLVLLVIFFLQTQGFLHPVNVLQEVPGLPVVQIDDYNFSFCTDLSVLCPLQPITSLVDLLQSFFQYFSQFTFGSQVVCPLLGQPVLIYSLRHDVFLPPCLQGCNRGKDKLKLGRPVIIQDPFELRRNVAGSVSPVRLDKLVRVFGTAARLLEREGLLGASSSKAGQVLVRLMDPDFGSCLEGVELLPMSQQRRCSINETCCNPEGPNSTEVLHEDQDITSKDSKPVCKTAVCTLGQVAAEYYLPEDDDCVNWK